MNLGPLLHAFQDSENGSWATYVTGLHDIQSVGATREEALDNARIDARKSLATTVAKIKADLAPPRLEDIAARVGESSQLTVIGTNSHTEYRLPNCDTQILDFSANAGIVEFSPEDQVIEVLAGTSLWFLQMVLALEGQCLPLVEWYDGWSPLNCSESTIGGAISMNLPHNLEAECGSWRDWVLGMTIILADGTVVKTGSQVVKSVAGYDLHKLMIGARGTLGVIASVILRTFPLGSLPSPRQPNRPFDVAPVSSWWIQRVRPSDFEAAWTGSTGCYAYSDPGTSTIWATVPSNEEMRRYPGDWVIRSGCGSKNLEFTDSAQIDLMKRAKEIFDPTHKLNPGEMGIF